MAKLTAQQIRTAKSKGRRLQNRVVELFKCTFDLTDDEIRSSVGREAGVDIKLSESGKKKVGLSIECKNQRTLNLWKALDQAIDNNYDGCEPAVVVKRGIAGPQETWIVIALDHYLSLRDELKRLKS